MCVWVGCVCVPAAPMRTLVDMRAHRATVRLARPLHRADAELGHTKGGFCNGMGQVVSPAHLPVTFGEDRLAARLWDVTDTIVSMWGATADG